MTVHWWMHWFWITRTLAATSKHNAVVAALLLVPLAAALPPRSAAGQPPSPTYDPEPSWEAWPPPYEDEEDDEDGFLGPRALPLQGQPQPRPPDDTSPSAEPASARQQDDGADTRAPEQPSPPEEQPAAKLVAPRDVQDVAPSSTVQPTSSSQLNISVFQTNNSSSTNASPTDAFAGTRESKSFSPSAPPSFSPPVKSLSSDVDGKSRTTGEETEVSAAPVDSATGSEVPVSGSPDASDSSVSPLASDVTPQADGSSQQPAEAYATAEGDSWTAYDASAADDQEAGQPEDSEPAPGLRSRPSEREAADEEEEAPEVAPVSRGRVAPAGPDAAPMDAASITGIALGIVVFASLIGTVSFVMYRRRFLNKPQTLNDKCSNPDSSGYIDDSTLRENSEEMYSLDNDSFLNSLEAMTIQNYWTDNVKHTKL